MPAFGSAARDGASRVPPPCALQRSLAASRSPTAHAVGAQWEFTNGEALAGAAWEVSYVVDVAEHQRELPLGRTPRTDYAPGACAAEFACEAIDVAGVPQGCVCANAQARREPLTQPVCGHLPRSWLNNIGVLKLVLRDADDAEVHASSLLTQIVRAQVAPCMCCLLSTHVCELRDPFALP